MDGVRIEKSLALETFDTPAIVFTVVSDRETAAYVKITDPLPDEIDPDDVGLHPEYDSEGWRRRGGNLRYEGRLTPDEQVETVYGLRVASVDQPSALLAEPTIDDVADADDGTTTHEDDADAGDDSTGPNVDLTLDDADADADADTGGDSTGPDVDLTLDGDGEDGEDGEDDEDGEDGVVTVGNTDPEPSPASTDDGESVRGRSRSSATPDTTVAAGTGLEDADGVAAALAQEFERGRVDETTREALEEHLQPPLPQSAEARLDKIQARLNDFEAYTDALERTLDRVGDDDDIVDEFDMLRRRLSGLEDETSDLRDDVDRTDDRLQSLAELDDDVATLQERFETVQEDLEAVRAELSEEMAEEVEALQSDLDDLQEWRETLADTLGGTE
jgi:archaellum component FlaC